MEMLNTGFSRRKFTTLAVASMAVAAMPRLTQAADDKSLDLAASPWPAHVHEPEKAGMPVDDNVDDLVKSTQGVSIPADLLKPGNIAIAPDHTAYVVASGNNRIDMYAGNGAYLGPWGDAGSGPGEFSFQGDGWNYGDIAIASDGTIYVADPGNNRVQVFDKDRNFQSSIEGWMRSDSREFDDSYTLTPAGLALDEANDRLYIADAVSRTIRVYRMDGIFLKEWGSNGLKRMPFLSLFDVAVGPDGTVYAPDFAASTISRLTSDGMALNFLGSHGKNPGQLMGASGIAVDGAGLLYVADYFNQQVKVVDPTRNTIVGVIAGDYGSPSGVAVQAPGVVWVSYEDNNLIMRHILFEMPKALILR